MPVKYLEVLFHTSITRMLMPPIPRRRGAAFAVVCLLTIIVTSGPALAQKDSPDIPTVTGAIAIENARIVQSPGRVIDQGTVLFRNGVIEAVGSSIDIPYDARVIDGDTLTVYAGLIDVLSHAAVPEPENDELDSVRDRSDPPFDRAGIQPDRDVRSMVDPGDKSVAAFRNLGFTAVHAVPRGRMLPGTTAVLLLTGTDVGEMTLRTTHAQFFQFRGARGVYPATPMGVMAQMRQLYRETARRIRLGAMYDEDPTGLSRPPSDAVHDALFPVVEGSTPVYVYTDDALEVHRALRLQEELEFRMVLTGLNQGFDTVDALAEAGHPIALTLDLPDEPDWMDDIKQDSLEQILELYDPDTRTATWRDVQAEKRNLEARQLMARKDYLRSPAMYAHADLRFGFTTMDVEAKDVHPNLRTFIENGLSEEDALAALTTNAAEILGLSAVMGSIETGKMANLVLTDGDLFEENTNIRMVIVDGNIYEIESKSPDKEGSGGRRDER